MPKAREPDPKTTDDLCQRLAAGMSIDAACRDIKLSPATFHRWRKRAEAGEGGENYQDFHERAVVERGHPRTQVEVEGWRSRDQFEEWAHKQVLDSGEPWRPEKWQLDAVEDMLASVGRDVWQAIWLVVGEGNGKTTLIAGVIKYLLENVPSPEIPIGSATTTQADTLFRQLEGFVERSKNAIDFKVTPGLRKIYCRKTHGFARVYAHNEKSGDGVIPSASVLDEGHLHPNLRLYRVWKGKYKKRQGPILMISTAGEPTSEFEEVRSRLIAQADEKTQRGPYIRAVKGKTVIHDWAVRDRKSYDDMEVVAEANPLRTIDAEWLREKFDEPDMTDAHWLRRTCNIPAREEGQAIESDEWDALGEEGVVPDRQAWAIGWIDLGWQIDCTALGVIVWESHSRRVIAGVRILKPPVDEGDIVRGLVANQREFQPVGWVYDPNAGGRQMAQLLEKGDHPQQEGTAFEFIDHAQTDAPMALATTRMDEAIRNGWIVFDPLAPNMVEMRRHVLNAVRKDLTGERSRYTKPPEASGTQGDQRAKFWNDALIGVSMGHSVAVADHETPEDPPAEIMQW